MYCRNAYDVNRHYLVDQVSRMRANFFQANVMGPRLQDQGTKKVFIFPCQEACITRPVAGLEFLMCEKKGGTL